MSIQEELLHLGRIKLGCIKAFPVLLRSFNWLHLPRKDSVLPSVPFPLCSGVSKKSAREAKEERKDRKQPQRPLCVEIPSSRELPRQPRLYSDYLALLIC